MRSALSALAVAVLAGCTAGPSYRRPEQALADRLYGEEGPSSAAALTDSPWWEVFRDPSLRALVDEALRNGYDVRIAAARVEQARARWGIAGADFYPSVAGVAGILQGHTSEFATPSDKTGRLITADVNVSWELDVWGRIRRLNQAARASYLATEEARRGVLLTLVSDVATAYFELRELDDELEIARRATGAFQSTSDLFGNRLAGGVASGLETARAEASLANEAAQIPLLERAIVAKENQLDLLLGRAPGPIARGERMEDQIAPPAIPPGLPSALLLRRPDVRQLEQELVAANATIGAAEAALYPTLTLTGLFGGQSPELATLLGGGRMWSIGAGLLAPLFNGGRLRGQRRLAVAEFEEARARYELGVTNALGEVSTSLVAMQKLTNAEAQRVHGVASNREAVRLATLRYESGFSAYFEVLDAIQLLLTSENGLAQTRRDRFVELVRFYKALGGGWTAEAK